MYQIKCPRTADDKLLKQTEITLKLTAYPLPQAENLQNFINLS